MFDTCAVTFLVKKDKRMLPLKSALDAGDWYASVITRIELYAEPHLSAEKLAGIDDFLAAAAVVGIGNAVEDVAIAIRRDFRPKLKLPDCIVAATSIVLGATLLTDDKGLKKLVWPGYTVKPL